MTEDGQACVHGGCSLQDSLPGVGLGSKSSYTSNKIFDISLLFTSTGSCEMFQTRPCMVWNLVSQPSMLDKIIRPS